MTCQVGCLCSWRCCPSNKQLCTGTTRHKQVVRPKTYQVRSTQVVVVLDPTTNRHQPSPSQDKLHSAGGWQIPRHCDRPQGWLKSQALRATLTELGLEKWRQQVQSSTLHFLARQSSDLPRITALAPEIPNTLKRHHSNASPWPMSSKNPCLDHGMLQLRRAQRKVVLLGCEVVHIPARNTGLWVSCFGCISLVDFLHWTWESFP